MTTLDPTILDKLLEGINPSDPQSLFSDAGLFGQLKKALAERMLQASASGLEFPRFTGHIRVLSCSMKGGYAYESIQGCLRAGISAADR